MKQTIYNKTFQILANADDTVLVGMIRCMLKEATVHLNKAVKKMGLTINIQMHGRNKKTKAFKVHDQEFERARDFKYLGFILANDNITTEMKQKFVTDDQTRYGLKEQLS